MITGIEVQKGDDEVTVAIAGDGAFKYEVQRLDRDRLIIDLANIKASTNIQTQQINHPLLRQIRVGRYTNKIRLVLDLPRPSSYSVHTGKTSLSIKLVPEKSLSTDDQSVAAGPVPTPGLSTMSQGKESMQPTEASINLTTDTIRVPGLMDQENVSRIRERPQAIQTTAVSTTVANTNPSKGREKLSQAESVKPTKPQAAKTAAEPYIAVYGGITVPSSFQDVRGIDTLSVFKLNDLDLSRSGIAGVKLGVFQPSGIKWFGMETEVFYTSPHVKQQDITFNLSGATIPCSTALTCGLEGAHVRVATWALNFILRYPGERFQPYAGAGLGIFWGRVSGGIGTASDTSPGLNALAGARLYLMKRVAIFGEYKFNRTTFDFGGYGDAAVSIRALYQAHHFVGGLSLQF